LCGSLEWLETPTAERCFSDHLPLGMIELDSQTIYHLNQTLRGWLQLRNVPPLPQRWEAVFPPALLRELGPLMQAVAAGSREQRLTWKERTLQLEAASDLTADGHKLMIVHDISRYQAAVQAMQHTEERWRRALEVSGDGVGTGIRKPVSNIYQTVCWQFTATTAQIWKAIRKNWTAAPILMIWLKCAQPAKPISPARRRCTSTNTGYRVKTAAGNGC
jgi:hypothetical protein